jgi:hypothetical protein
MSLEEFREYVSNSGVNFDGLSNEERRQWRETFDRSRQHQQPAGDIKLQMREVLEEHDRLKEERTIVMSSASATDVHNLLLRLNLSVMETMTRPPPSTGCIFDPFVWTGDEKPGTSAAHEHLYNQLKNFGVPFDVDNFKLVDVHTDNNILTVEDEKLGKISGGTDLALLPYRVSDSMLASGFCVLFELKTTKVFTEMKTRKQIVGQALLELICGRIQSEQPSILVILTDLCTSTLVYTIAQREECEDFYIQEYQLSLEQMAEFVVEFLQTPSNARKRVANLSLNDGKAETASGRLFKKRYTAPLSSLAWEHYLEEAETSEPWTKDRSTAIANLLMSCGVEKLPTLLNPSLGMFS